MAILRVFYFPSLWGHLRCCPMQAVANPPPVVAQVEVWVDGLVFVSPS